MPYNILSRYYSNLMGMESDNSPHTIVIPALYLLIAFIGVVGNLSVLVVFALNRRLQDSTNALIANLAAADLLFLIFCVPFTAHAYAKPWPFPSVVCDLTIYLQYVCAYASVWTLVLLALDRFLAVVYPVSAMQLRNTRNVTKVCAILWAVIFAANLPSIQSIGVLEYEYDNKTFIRVCVDSMRIAERNASKSEVVLYYAGFNIGAFLLPLSITCVLYVQMVRTLWRQKGELKVSKESFRLKRRITKLVWVIILTFAICWLPQNIRFAMKAFYYPLPIFWESDGDLLFIIQSTAQTLAYANSCLNPILYGLMSERFREGFRRSYNVILQRLCRHCGHEIEDRRRKVTIALERNTNSPPRSCRAPKNTQLGEASGLIAEVLPPANAVEKNPHASAVDV